MIPGHEQKLLQVKQKIRFQNRIQVLYLIERKSDILGRIMRTNMTIATKQINRMMAILLLIVAVIALSVAAFGTVCEADCDDNCQKESGSCCDCDCCPNNVVMTSADNHAVKFEYVTFLWTLSRAAISGKQEWFTSIDHPPQELS